MTTLSHEEDDWRKAIEGAGGSEVDITKIDYHKNFSMHLDRRPPIIKKPEGLAGKKLQDWEEYNRRIQDWWQAEMEEEGRH